MPLRPGEPFERYRVEALLGEGGMGQVYRATDDRLRRQVALKVISVAAGGALGAGVAARLLREARAAAAIDHPNAIAIFDVGESDGIPFLAMELVDGATLRRHVGDASVPLVQRLHWLLAVARALAAAHRRGLVHRDIKPENVMVRADGIVKVLDFGIARPAAAWEDRMVASGEVVSPGSSALSPVSLLTGDSAAVGTPMYMSPEQLRGEALDGRSDQFAWGVLAWELVTGRLPWPVDQGGPTAVNAILSTNPPPLGQLVAEVSHAVESIVQRALRKPREGRFETTDALVAALEQALGVETFVSRGPTRASVSPSARTVEAPQDRRSVRRRRQRLLAAGAVAAAIACTTGAVAWRSHKARTTTEARLALAASARRPAVAVLGDVGAVRELLATDLAMGGQIRVVPRDVAARALGAVDEGRPDRAALARLRAVASAEYAVVATEQLRGERVLLAVRIVGIASDDAVDVSADGRRDELPAIVSRAGAEVLRVLGRAPLAPEQAAAMRAAMPTSSAAADAYAEGLACRARYDDGGAIGAFERAIAAEDGFALAHHELSRELAALGFDRRALDEATRAQELSVSLGREQRLVIEAQHDVAAKDWSSASDRYRTLFDFFPDNLDYGIAFGRAQVLAGKRPEAFATLDRLRAVPRTAVEEARLDLFEAFMASKTADVKRSLAASMEAKRKADALGAAWISGEARTSIAEAYIGLGEAGRGAAELEEARAIFERLGDRSRMAGVFRQEAGLAEARGDYDGALGLIDQALALAKQVGDQYRIGGLLTHRAIVLARTGAFNRAETGFDEARALYESIQDLEGVAHNTGNAAEMRIAHGQLAGCRSAFEHALAIHKQIGMRAGIEEQTLNVAWTIYLEGDAAAAGKGIDEGLALARTIGDWQDIRDALVRRGTWLRARDDAAGAGAAYDEAASLASRAGDANARAEVDLAQARLALDRGRTADAMTLARGALDRFVTAKLPHDEALARAVVVRALVAARALDDAAREHDALQAVLPKSQLFEARFEALLAASELAAARGDREEALRVAGEARTAAEQSGFVPLVLEARLGELRLSVAATKTAARASLDRDARAAGCLRVARLAGR